MKGQERKKRKPAYWFWAILFLVMAGGILWSYRYNLTARSIKFAIAQTGTITHESTVTAIFANQELPITAPVSGQIKFAAEEGQRFRRGEAVAAIQPGNQTVFAGMGGLFFRETDGLETIMTSENLATMDLDKLLSQTGNEKSAGTSVNSGEVVGKMVNNLYPTQAFVEIPNIEGLTVGKTLRFSIGTQTLSAKILRKSDKPRGVVVQFPNYVDGSAIKRHQEISWVFLPPTSGVLVPKSALWTQGEELGIFLESEGVVHFKKVKVLDEDNSQACIENLPNGIPVVITPREGLEGLVPM